LIYAPFPTLGPEPPKELIIVVYIYCMQD